jgi:UDP-N-acetylmuramate dehydrogenase
MVLAGAFGDRLKKDEPLKKHTNYRIGGPADFYLELKSGDEVSRAVTAAKKDGVPIFVLGGGSNILVSDAGFRGLVIVLAMRSVLVEGQKCIADAGAVTAAVAKKSAEAGLTGFEWAVGVPGTIGGAVRGNAGCFGDETRSAVETVEAISLESGEKRFFMSDECGFAYRESRFKHERSVVTRVTLALKTGEREAGLAAIKNFISRRKEKQPLEYSSAGCIFKNYEIPDNGVSEKLLAVLPKEFVDAKRVPAGWLIDQAGLKGATSGDAKISDKHGNFFVNVGGADASDIVILISRVKTAVRDAYGVQLNEEIQLVGF